MREHVFTAVDRTGWHIDGSFQPALFAYSLCHMVSVPLKGDTVFAPLNKIVDNLPSEYRNEWERQGGEWLTNWNILSSDISTSYYTKEGELQKR